MDLAVTGLGSALEAGLSSIRVIIASIVDEIKTVGFISLFFPLLSFDVPFLSIYPHPILENPHT